MLALPGTASAFRDCCFARSIPPRLVGVTLNGPIDQVLGSLERAGFGDYDPGNRRISGLGYLTGMRLDAPPAGSDQIGGQVLGPSIVCFEMMCGSGGGAMLMTMGGQPNGARLLRVVIAVVPDLDAACRTMEGSKRGPWATPRFGEPYDDPSLGARVRETRIGLGSLRLIAPTDPDGPAARWLANGGTRWIGFAVEVGDLYATEQWLTRSKVPFVRDIARGDAVVRIDPAELGGLLVEFVPSGRF